MYAKSAEAGSTDDSRLRTAISRIIHEWDDPFQRSFAVAAFLLDHTTDTDELDEDGSDRAVMDLTSLAKRVGGDRGVAYAPKLRGDIWRFLESKQS